ncbi:MAG: penicillin-binding protein 2 [Bacillota bacterium]|nr:penicillin-binding protein 2 [Bacillota bacterium]
MKAPALWPLRLTVLLVAAVLLLRLGQLQIVQGEVWAQQARDQIIRELSLPAPRGEITDRSGIVLAQDRPSWTAYLVYSSRPLDEEGIALLSRILDLDPDAVRKARDKLRPSLSARPFEPVPLKFDLTAEEQVAISENLDQLPGVMVRPVPIRQYPGFAEAPDQGGTFAAHLLGYVYPGGKTGIERTYDGPLEVDGKTILGLQGIDGIQRVQVDHRGRPIPGAPIYEEPPTPGNTVRLTLDAHLQAVAQRALRQRMEYLRTATVQGKHPEAPTGAVVVLEVKTGAILAMASEPTFDPNVFALTAGYTKDSPGWQAFQNAYRSYTENPALGTLSNHALTYRHATGSTFKMMTALAGLSTGVITPEKRLADPGYFQVGNTRWHPWHRGGCGRPNLEEALARSCNVYFYTVGYQAGIDAIAKVASQFGLQEGTGLKDLEGEVTPHLASRELKLALTGNPWVPGDTVNASIGQGYNAFTPIQMAQMVATLATGERYRPYLVDAILSPEGEVLWQQKPELLNRVDLPESDLQAVRKGMLAVTSYNPHFGAVDSPYGTGYSAFADLPETSQKILGRTIRVAAKTGTAEGRATSDGWFVAYAPYDDPQIAIAVAIEKAGGGALAGALVARALVDAYFGLPITPVAPGVVTAPPVSPIAP